VSAGIQEIAQTATKEKLMAQPLLLAGVRPLAAQKTALVATQVFLRAYYRQRVAIVLF
jgi:hypothetical protein